MLTAIIVLYEERPGGPGLVHVDDGADDVGVKLPGKYLVRNTSWDPVNTLSTWVASQEPVLYLLMP